MCLGYADPMRAVYTHCRGRVKITLPTTSGEQPVTIIPESDVYRLVGETTLPSAERFKDWMYEEVFSRRAPLEIKLADEPATQEIPESPAESDRPDGIDYWLANDEPSTSLIALEFDGQRVRTVTKDGKPYFVANDVARCLGYSRPANAIKQHCKGVTATVTPTPGGKQKTAIIPESDVFRLINASTLPSAERFKDWVNEEVLPSIRKTGAYVVPGATLGPAALILGCA